MELLLSWSRYLGTENVQEEEVMADEGISTEMATFTVPAALPPELVAPGHGYTDDLY